MKNFPDRWKFVQSSPIWYILWIWKKSWKKNWENFFSNFFWKFFFEIFLKKKCSEFFFQIHKIYHLGMLCTNFQCSGIILFIFSNLAQFGLETIVVYPNTINIFLLKVTWCISKVPFGNYELFKILILASLLLENMRE